MGEVSLSLWLPIGRANFYSGTANGWLHEDERSGLPEGMMVCASRRITEEGYLPMLQASVIRRLLEVLPMSFGYDSEGISHVSDEIDEHDRPIDLEIKLTPNAGVLAGAGVTEVRLFVDEHGFYTFTAYYPEGLTVPDRVRSALQQHMCDVFGSEFSVNRLRERRSGVFSEGGAAVRRYNGLDDETPEIRVGTPMGVLSFFQLNTIAEGLFNDTLSPAVFFEQYKFMREFLEHTEQGKIAAATSVRHTLGHVIDVITIATDARTDVGQITALHHFLGVTSREVLQKLKWSVESVRRGLLEEMMGVLHRQSRLIQLDLGASPKERTPELAVDATESQLRGYVMLISAKLPLVHYIHELAMLAEQHIRHLITVQQDVAHRRDLHDLEVLLKSWKALLEGLGRNVISLEGAIEQAWMERLLYEQEQSRSEQEAMAEIERSHRSRPAAGRVGTRAYNWIMLIFTILAVVVTVQTTENNPAGSLVQRMLRLWPVLVAVSAFFAADAIFSTVRRLAKDRRGASQNYTYEFSFRLDERTNPLRVFDFMNKKKHDAIWSTKLGRALFIIPWRRLLITRVGGARIERISLDTTLVKFHIVATFRAVRLRYARFEVVSEVLASRVSDQPRYVLRQSRIFGDSPVPLKASVLLELVDRVIKYVGLPLAADKSLDDLLDLVEPFYSREKLQVAWDKYGQDWLADDSAPMSAEPVTMSLDEALAGLAAQRQPKDSVVELPAGSSRRGRS